MKIRYDFSSLLTKLSVHSLKFIERMTSQQIPPSIAGQERRPACHAKAAIQRRLRGEFGERSETDILKNYSKLKYVLQIDIT